jgi:hypothetical protein
MQPSGTSCRENADVCSLFEIGIGNVFVVPAVIDAGTANVYVWSVILRSRA